MGTGYNPNRDPKTGQFTSGDIEDVSIDYKHFYDVKNAIISTTPEKDGARQFPTEAELFERRKELEIERRKEEAERLNKESKLRDKELKKTVQKQKKIQELHQEIEKWTNIKQDPFSSPYLKAKADKELKTLKNKLNKL